VQRWTQLEGRRRAALGVDTAHAAWAANAAGGQWGSAASAGVAKAAGGRWGLAARAKATLRSKGGPRTGGAQTAATGSAASEKAAPSSRNGFGPVGARTAAAAGGGGRALVQVAATGGGGRHLVHLAPSGPSAAVLRAPGPQRPPASQRGSHGACSQKTPPADGGQVSSEETKPYTSTAQRDRAVRLASGSPSDNPRRRAF